MAATEANSGGSEGFCLSSMTGFAAAQGASEGWTWTVDMRSVNGRGLDIRYRLPDWIEGLEPELRKRMQAQIQRGTVSVGIRLQRDESAGGFRLNPDALTQAVKVLAEVQAAAQAGGLEIQPVSAAAIAGLRGVLEATEAAEADTVALRSGILETAGACLEAFVADRRREGSAIAGVIQDQIARIGSHVAAARVAAGDREAASREAMLRAVTRLLELTDIPDEARLVQELALIAVKNDVTEELDRLDSHISAARELLGQDVAVGRKFDFLMQEFNREANTLCAKSQSTALTALGLDLKALIDQMREQVQNIE